MIKLNIVAVGKLKEKFWGDAIKEYVKRTSKYAELTITECPEGNDEGNAERLQKQEEAGILKNSKAMLSSWRLMAIWLVASNLLL